MATRNSGFVRDPHDWYMEPAWCTELLLEREHFVGGIFDPACGAGTITKVCQEKGFDVLGRDIVDRGYGEGGFDFLKTVMLDQKYPNIICNPPYEQAEVFIQHACALAKGKVAMFVQEKFLFSQRRYPLFTETPVKHIWFFSSRPSVPPGELLQSGAIKAVGGSVNYVWVVWENGYQGPPTCGWLIRSAWPKGISEVRGG
jgi:hypothetical protein